jgi:hypothetical protein
MNARCGRRLMMVGALIAASTCAYADSESAAPSKPAGAGDDPAALSVPGAKAGIVFHCSPAETESVKAAMSQYLDAFHWQAGREVLLAESVDGRLLNYRLRTPAADTNTLDLSSRADLSVGVDALVFTRLNRKTCGEETLTLPLVSQKEILAALLSPGRATELRGGQGAVEKLKDHVAIRQNTVRWTQRACWEYAAQKEVVYDPKKWHVGSDGWFLPEGVKAHEAVADAFISKTQYKMGCQRACRFIMVQGIMDYYARVKRNEAVLSHLESLADGRPINDIAPPQVDEPGSAPQRAKYLDRVSNVPWNNWVAGDWGYIRNPDEASRTTISGYEGSNIIYIGRGVFGVYYCGPKTRTLDRSLMRVFRWRYEADNPPPKQPETPELLEQLRKTPAEGGFLLSHRFVPQMFELPGFEETAEDE